MNAERTITVNDDGTISPEQLEGMPQDFLDMAATPAWQANARKAIQRQREADKLRSHGKVIRELAQVEHQARRPDGISGRQRKRLRRIVRKLACAKIQNEQGGLRP